MRQPATGLLIATCFACAACISTNAPNADRQVTMTDVALATDGSLLIGGYGQRIDIVEENSPEPRGDFFLGRITSGDTTVDRWVGTPEPERIRGISATSGGGMLAYGAAMTSACDDSAWHQRGALMDVNPVGGVLRAVTLSRTTTIPLAGCEFPEPFHVSWATKTADRVVFAGDWLAYDDHATNEGLTVGSFADELQWSNRFAGETTLGDVAVVGDTTYAAVNTSEGAVLSRIRPDGTIDWSVRLDWVVTAVTAKSTGVDLAGFCPSEEVCVARLSPEGDVTASRRITDLEAETVDLASGNTVAAWDGTKLFYLQFDEDLELQNASFVEAGAAPADVAADQVAWVVDGEVQAWRVGESCARPEFVIEDLAVADAGLAVIMIDDVWLTETLELETWTVVPEPRGEEITVTDCR